MRRHKPHMARGDKDEGGNVPMASDGCGGPWSVVPNKEDQHRQERGFTAFRGSKRIKGCL